jgi:hypothetical protein
MPLLCSSPFLLPHGNTTAFPVRHAWQHHCIITIPFAAWQHHCRVALTGEEKDKAYDEANDEEEESEAMAL